MCSWHGCWNTDPETAFSELRPRPGSEAWETGICRVFVGAGQRKREGTKDEETPDSQTGQTVNQSWMEFGSQK